MCKEKCTDYRTINYVYDPRGNKGKSTICGIIDIILGGIIVIPSLNYKDTVQWVASNVSARLKEKKTVPALLVDVPRGLGDTKMAELFAGLETMKNGYLFDTRFKGRSNYINSPHIWVFCNCLPNFGNLVKDRWKMWKVNSAMELVEYTGSYAAITDKLFLSDQLDELNALKERRAELESLMKTLQAEIEVVDQRISAHVAFPDNDELSKAFREDELMKIPTSPLHCKREQKKETDDGYSDNEENFTLEDYGEDNIAEEMYDDLDD